MKIDKISKLKNFGIFHDFSWNKELPDFKKFNLIYGWNRSGKTTISRVFASCEKKNVYDQDTFKQYPENGEFEIKTDIATLKNTDVATNSLPIKVFNKDFIDENISFDPLDSCNPIIYVSEGAIESKKQLDTLKSNIETLAYKYQETKTLKEGSQRIEDNFRISVAQTITQLLTDKTKRDRYYSYDKSKVKEKIDEIGVDNFSDKALSDEDEKKYESISKSDAGNEQALLLNYQFSFSFDGEVINDSQKIFENVEKLLGKKVVSKTLERLKNDQDLNIWVKQGFDLHKTKGEKEKCLFCQKSLDDDFLNSLSKHFSKDYEDLQKAIVQMKDEVLKIKGTEIALKNDDLYPGLEGEYTAKAKELNEIIEKINAWIDDDISKLNEKYNNPLIVVANHDTPEDFLSLYNQAITELNKVITNHNEKVKNHTTVVAGAKEKLELHSIAIALSAQDYNKFSSELKDAEAKEKVALEAVNKNDFEISKLEKENSNIGKAIEEINKYLKEFFGQEEIKLELDGDKKGYTIKRDGQPAKNLSEGEKTAIAFSYFIVKVEEKEFKIKDGIIFIDDPISSFDSNFIYHCFSLIKNHFNEAGQLFISTHNFQLFNLIKDWFLGKNRNTKEDNKDRKLKNKKEKQVPCEFYMIKSDICQSKRIAKIVTLDKTLRTFKSEYTFLFSLLNNFDKKNEEPTFEEIYNIANIGRRFFDIFADFKIPTNSKEQKDKINMLVDGINESKSEGDKISKISCDKVFWLINGFSHNSDPTSTIEHKDKSESRDAIKILLSIVKESDPTHYKILEKNCSAS